MNLTLYLELLSDTTFGRGEGSAGTVDVEIEHDEKTGLPSVNGRRLKGLLVEECAELLYATGSPGNLVSIAQKLFGTTGSSADQEGILRVGKAQFPQAVRSAVLTDIQHHAVQPTEVFNALTTVRRQTAVDNASGAPKKGSLRAMRVLVHGITLEAQLELLTDDDAVQKTACALLAACAASLRRAGAGRNRGRGWVNIYLNSVKEQAYYLDRFAAYVGVHS